MSAVRAKVFTKTPTCPLTEDITSSRLPRGKSDQIARHFVGCQFCSAEQSFLSAFSPATEEYKAAEMPAHLRRLDEALLRKAERFSLRIETLKGILALRTGFRI